MKVLWIVLLSVGTVYAQQTSFFNADGFFTIGTQSYRTASIHLIDMDLDGDLDALIANGRHWAEPNYLYYNDGKGGFKEAQTLGPFWDASYAIQGGDFNNDGFMDIAVANDQVPHKIYFGAAGQLFIQQDGFGSLAPSRNLEVADIDQDGDLDLILSNRKQENEICLNNGQGKFDQILKFGNSQDQTLQTLVIDMNGDGLLDLVTAQRQGRNKIYVQQGTLDFSKVIEFGDAMADTRAIGVADFNKDGFLDIVSGNLGASNILYWGNEEGTFTQSYTFEAKRMTASIAVADLDQDGYWDVVEGNSEDRNFVYLGQPGGTFKEIGLRKDAQDDTYHVSVGDLNGDGLWDIVEANSGGWNLYYRTRKE